MSKANKFQITQRPDGRLEMDAEFVTDKETADRVLDWMYDKHHEAFEDHKVDPDKGVCLVCGEGTYTPIPTAKPTSAQVRQALINVGILSSNLDPRADDLAYSVWAALQYQLTDTVTDTAQSKESSDEGKSGPS